MCIEYGQGQIHGEFSHYWMENIKGKHKEMVKELGREILQFFSLIMAAKREFQKFSLKCSDLFQSNFSEKWCCLKDDCTGLVIE